MSKNVNKIISKESIIKGGSKMINTNDINKKENNKEDFNEVLKKVVNGSEGLTEDEKEKNYIYDALINAKDRSVFDEDSNYQNFKKYKKVEDFSSVKDLLIYIRDNLNQQIYNTYALALLVPIEVYTSIYEIGNKYGINIEKSFSSPISESLKAEDDIVKIYNYIKDGIGKYSDADPRVSNDLIRLINGDIPIDSFLAPSDLLIFIKDKLNYKVDGKPALKYLLIKGNYDAIYDIGKRYNIDIEKTDAEDLDAAMAKQNSNDRSNARESINIEYGMVNISSDSDLAIFYKSHNIERIPALYHDDKDLAYESICKKANGKNIIAQIPVLKDEFSGAEFMIVDFYDPHKFYEYIKAGLADSIKTIIVKSNSTKFAVSFIISHINRTINNGYLEEAKMLLSNTKKEFIVVPKEVIGDKYKYLNDRENARFILNKLYNQDGFFKPTKIYDGDAQAYNDVGKYRLNSVEVIPVLLNTENNKIIF